MPEGSAFGNGFANGTRVANAAEALAIKNRRRVRFMASLYAAKSNR